MLEILFHGRSKATSRALTGAAQATLVHTSDDEEKFKRCEIESLDDAEFGTKEMEKSLFQPLVRLIYFMTYSVFLMISHNSSFRHLFL